LEMYITGIIQNHRHKMLAIGSLPDHLHILIGYNLNQLIPDLVEEIKTSSNSWIKGKRLSKFKFEWQKGYGAFTHSHSQIDTAFLQIPACRQAGFAALLLLIRRIKFKAN
jgi:putative transposase